MPSDSTNDFGQKQNRRCFSVRTIAVKLPDHDGNVKRKVQTGRNIERLGFEGFKHEGAIPASLHAVSMKPYTLPILAGPNESAVKAEMVAKLPP